MNKNFKKLKSNFSKNTVLIMTFFLGFLGIDDLYVRKYFRFGFKLALFIGFIVITIMAKNELDKTDSFLQKLLDFAKSEADKKVDSNGQDYRSAEGVIKLLLEVSKLVFEKVLNDAITIAIILFIWVATTTLLLASWITTFISTLVGLRRDGYGLRIKYSGISVDEFIKTVAN